MQFLCLGYEEEDGRNRVCLGYDIRGSKLGALGVFTLCRRTCLYRCVHRGVFNQVKGDKIRASQFKTIGDMVRSYDFWFTLSGPVLWIYVLQRHPDSKLELTMRDHDITSHVRTGQGT